MQCLTIPIDVRNKVNTILFRFLWKKKNTNTKAFEKVKRTVLCSSIEKGGLNMININDMQNSFTLSWAVNLLNSTRQIWHAIPRFWFTRIGLDLSCFSSNVPSKSFIGIGNIKSYFWRQVLTTWLDNKHKVETVLNNNRHSSCLWNNTDIKYRNKPLFFRDWIDHKICYINDMQEEGNIISFEQVLEKVGPKPSRLFEYNAIHTALRSRAAANLINQLANGLESIPLPVGNTMPSPRTLRLQLTESAYARPCAVNFWIRKYNVQLHDDHWTLASHCTKEVRLNLLHWKILHNIFPTNILLNKMGIKQSKNCTYCDTTDFIEHFFWSCIKIRKIWKCCTNLIEKHTSNKINLSETEVLFGYNPEHASQNVIKFINHVILITKMCVSKFRYGVPTDLEVLFETEIRYRWKSLKQHVHASTVP